MTAGRWNRAVLLMFSSLTIAMLVAAALSGCGSPMVRYYQATSTAALTATQCYQALDGADASQHKQALALRSQGDEAGALKSWETWLPKYKAVRTACDAVYVAAVAAKAATPTVEAAINKETAIAPWIARLVSLGMAVVSALSEIGVTLPGGVQ